MNETCLRCYDSDNWCEKCIRELRDAKSRLEEAHTRDLALLAERTNALVAVRKNLRRQNEHHIRALQDTERTAAACYAEVAAEADAARMLAFSMAWQAIGLTAALERIVAYANHKSDCKRRSPLYVDGRAYNGVPCSCGINDALAALDAALAAPGGWRLVRCQACGADETALRERCDALRAENERLRKALEWIERMDLDAHPITDGSQRDGYWCDGPCGDVARAALSPPAGEGAKACETCEGRGWIVTDESTANETVQGVDDCPNCDAAPASARDGGGDGE